MHIKPRSIFLNAHIQEKMVTVAVRYQYDVDLGHYELPCLTMINPEETIQKTNNAKGQQPDLKCLVNLVVNHVVMMKRLSQR